MDWFVPQPESLAKGAGLIFIIKVARRGLPASFDYTIRPIVSTADSTKV
jgi:hypothetical protein